MQKKDVFPITGRKSDKKYFSLQWHITANCANNCSHCYLQNTDQEVSEIKNELSIERCFSVVDDFYETISRWNIGGKIFFTGGDPLLKDGFLELMKYARSKGMEIGIMGNATFLDRKIVDELREVNIFYYQLSIEGREKVHDEIRGKGNFKETIEGIRTLKEGGLSPVVMFTLSKANMKEIIPVINLVAKEGVSSFDFARLVPIGNGFGFQDELIEPEEYRNLLVSILREYKKLRKEGATTIFGRKDQLWKLLYYELGLFNIPKKNNKIFDGCHMGIAGMVVGADGVVYPCRRLPLEAGKVPEEKLRDIFIESEVFNLVRKVENLEKCSKCELFNFCRGCPAVTQGVTGDFLKADPQCWK